jgi:hypothetical protein
MRFVYLTTCLSRYISAGKYSMRTISLRRTNGILSAIGTAPASTIKSDMNSRLGSTRCGALYWPRGRVNRTRGSTLLCALAVTTSLVVAPAFAQSVGGGGGGGGGGTGGGNGGVGGIGTTAAGGTVTNSATVTGGGGGGGAGSLGGGFISGLGGGGGSGTGGGNGSFAGSNGYTGNGGTGGNGGDGVMSCTRFG